MCSEARIVTRMRYAYSEDVAMLGDTRCNSRREREELTVLTDAVVKLLLNRIMHQFLPLPSPSQFMHPNHESWNKFMRGREEYDGCDERERKNEKIKISSIVPQLGTPQTCQACKSSCPSRY